MIYFSVLHPQGLTSTFARQILERDGPNELKPPKGTPEYVKFARQLAGGLQCLMWVAAIICFIAFGIELAQGNLTSFDNVNYISIQSVYPIISLSKQRYECQISLAPLTPAVLGHHPNCCRRGDWLLWLLPRV